MDNDQHEVMSLLSPQFALFVGLVMFFCAWHFGGTMAELKFNGLAAEGEVIRVESPKNEENPHDRDADRFFYAVVSFRDEKGETHSFMDRKGTWRRNKYTEGERLVVLYRQEDPEGTAVIDRGMAMWMTPGLFAFFGCLFLFSALTRLQGSSRAV